MKLTWKIVAQTPPGCLFDVAVTRARSLGFRYMVFNGDIFEIARRSYKKTSVQFKDVK